MASSRRFHVNKNELSDESENEESYEEVPRRSKLKQKSSDDSDNSNDHRNKKKNNRKSKQNSAWNDEEEEDDDDDYNSRNRRKGGNKDNDRQRNATREKDSNREEAWGNKKSSQPGSVGKSSNAWTTQRSRNNMSDSGEDEEEDTSNRKKGWSSAKPTPKETNSKKPREYTEEDEADIDAEDDNESRPNNHKIENKTSKGFVPRTLGMPAKPKAAAPANIRAMQNRLAKEKSRGGGRGNKQPVGRKRTDEVADDLEEEELQDLDPDFNPRSAGSQRTVSGKFDTINGRTNKDPYNNANSRTKRYDVDEDEDVVEEELADEEDMGGGSHYNRNSRDTNDYGRGSRGYASPLYSQASSMGNPSISFVLQAHENGGDTDHVQCVIVRDRSGLASKVSPTYRLYLENKNKLLITAIKNQFNRTSNYHMYDMTRGQAGSKLSKKSGNYLGKLRARNVNRTEYVLITQASEREEVAAVVFDRHGIVDQLKEGSLPRKMSVMVPQLDLDAVPVPHRIGENGSGSMIDMLLNNEDGNMFVFESKEPVFENGNFRLNFRGRVSVPSVKNFQLVSPDDIDHVICQFGKIGEDRYHLDYKAPLNAFQALALALCQFNL